MFGIFKKTTDEKRRDTDRAIFRRVKEEHAQKKVDFRQNLINKMTFVHPNMVLLVNLQSDVFFGYDSKAKNFVYGKFYDFLLGDLFELEKFLGSSDFENEVTYFMEDMELNNTQHKISSVISRFSSHEYPDHDDGYFICSEKQPVEVRLKKNDKIIARSGPYSPKHKGYFKEALYKNIVEDTNGNGASRLEVSFGLFNGGEIEGFKTFYIYKDWPRSKVGPDIEHYVRVCSLFAPLLDSIECDILCENINFGDYLDLRMEGTDEEFDDTLLGLEENPLSVRTIAR